MKKRSIAMGMILSFVLLAPAIALGELTDLEYLGKLIFEDNSLSAEGNQSCAACHAAEVGWTGPHSEINAHGAAYEGSIEGRFGNRKPPSAAYATQAPILHYTRQGGGMFVGGNFWDGNATGEKLGNPAADQAQGPFLNPLEQALLSPEDVVYGVCNGTYSDLFLDVWGDDACFDASAAFDMIALSIAAYEASPEVNAFSSKYDAYLQKKVDLTKEEKRGLNLFQGKAKCAKCHPAKSGPKGEPALFTDYTFDNLGVPRNPENPFYEQLEFNPEGYDWIDTGLGGFLLSQRVQEEHPEWFARAEGNMGMHKVPTLRNVDKRPFEDFVKAYGHNGYFKTLKGIVHFYNTRDVLPVCPGDYTETEAMDAGCWPAPEVAANVNMKELGDLKLTPEEEDAIVAFLKTLSDGYQE